MRRRSVFSLTGLALLGGTTILLGCGVRIRTGGAAPAAALVPDEQVPRIDVDAAFAAVTAGRAVLIDVRSQEAWRSSHAQGAVSLPLDDVEKLPTSASATLPAGKQPILYCT